MLVVMCSAKPAATARVPTLDWEVFVRNCVAERVIKCKCETKELVTIRANIYELLTHCIPASVIMECIVSEILKSVEPSFAGQVVEWASFYVRVEYDRSRACAACVGGWATLC